MKLYENLYSEDIVIIAFFTGIISFVSGTILYQLSPAGFPLQWQHVYEIGSIVLGIYGGFLLHQYIFNQKICSNKTILAIGLGGAAITALLEPLVNVWTITGRPTIVFGLLAAIEAIIVLGIAYLISKIKCEYPEKLSFLP